MERRYQQLHHRRKLWPGTVGAWLSHRHHRVQVPVLNHAADLIYLWVPHRFGFFCRKGGDPCTVRGGNTTLQRGDTRHHFSRLSFGTTLQVAKKLAKGDVLKGHSFSCAVQALYSCHPERALAREGSAFAIFPQPLFGLEKKVTLANVSYQGTTSQVAETLASTNDSYQDNFTGR